MDSDKDDDIKIKLEIDRGQNARPYEMMITKELLEDIALSEERFDKHMKDTFGRVIFKKCSH